MTNSKPDRKCYICKERKLKSEFYAEPSRAGGLANHCKQCATTRHRNYVQRMPPRQKLGYKLKYLYQMTLDQYDSMLADQEGNCKICTRFLLEPHVDHDHACCPGEKSCGKCVRGLLCTQCNTAAGLLDDDPNRVMALAFYLTQRMDVLNVTT